MHDLIYKKQVFAYNSPIKMQDTRAQDAVIMEQNQICEWKNEWTHQDAKAQTERGRERARGWQKGHEWWWHTCMGLRLSLQNSSIHTHPHTIGTQSEAPDHAYATMCYKKMCNKYAVNRKILKIDVNINNKQQKHNAISSKRDIRWDVLSEFCLIFVCSTLLFELFWEQRHQNL